MIVTDRYKDAVKNGEFRLSTHCNELAVPGGKPKALIFDLPDAHLAIIAAEEYPKGRIVQFADCFFITPASASDLDNPYLYPDARDVMAFYPLFQYDGYKKYEVEKPDYDLKLYQHLTTPGDQRIASSRILLGSRANMVQQYTVKIGAARRFDFLRVEYNTAIQAGIEQLSLSLVPVVDGESKSPQQLFTAARGLGSTWQSEDFKRLATHKQVFES